MKDLIEALTIFLKYGNPMFPTHCEHDMLYVMIDPATVSAEDLDRLEALDFFPNYDFANIFASYRYGSA